MNFDYDHLEPGEYTFPTTPEYRRRAKSIERSYRVSQVIAWTFLLISYGVAGWEVYQIGMGNFLSLIALGIYIYLIILWTRDLKRIKEARITRYILLTREIAMDANLAQLIKFEEDHQ